MLEFSARIAEAQVNISDVLVLDHFEDVTGGHYYSPFVQSRSVGPVLLVQLKKAHHATEKANSLRNCSMPVQRLGNQEFFRGAKVFRRVIFWPEG